MKLGSILLLLWSFFVLFSLTKESDVGYPNIKYCARPLNGLSGTCLTGKIDCYEAFRRKFPGSDPRRCRCDTNGNTHNCTCCIVCGLKYEKILVNQDDYQC
ncbi:Chitinase [Medicago truncatula]|uniref:Chitinase n=1 Tax=Medicago truncatula TaxID=3880 RepID=G7KSX6_MEDTR|nr:Chitinase [Medicago truncatula]